jgi:hypothetical protein
MIVDLTPFEESALLEYLSSLIHRWPASGGPGMEKPRWTDEQKAVERAYRKMEAAVARPVSGEGDSSR